MKHRAGIRSIGLLVTLGLLAASGEASAAGFAVARFGGEHGNPVATNVTSIYYNPAGLAFGHGHRLYLDGVFALRSASYDRPVSAIDADPPSELDIAANSGEGTLSNFLVSPFIGFATDFGTDLPLAFAVGFYAPFGGQSVWDSVEPVEGAPGAVDGPQRWYVMDGTIRTLAITGAFAYRIESARLSFGLGANLYLSEIDTIRARNANGTDAVTSGDGGLQEGRSWLRADATNVGIGAGVMWEAVENTFWIGASYQSQPGFGEYELTGTLDNALAISPPSQNQIEITQSLPDIIRLGFRFRPMDALELRLFGDYTRWSAFEQQCIVNTELPGDNETVCAVGADGGRLNEENSTRVIQNLQRSWEDTFGVRLGASWYANEQWELMVGAGYDSNAIPDEFLEPALMDFDKVTASLGARWQAIEMLGLALTLTNVFYFERDTTGVGTGETLAAPSRQPSSEGVYNQNVLVINLGLDFQF